MSRYGTKEKLTSLDHLLFYTSTGSLSERLQRKDMTAPPQWFNTWLKEDPKRLDLVYWFSACYHSLRQKAKRNNLFKLKSKIHESTSSVEKHLTKKTAKDLTWSAASIHVTTVSDKKPFWKTFLNLKVASKKAPPQWTNTWLKDDPKRLDLVDCFYACYHSLR